jgi:hypothetical protein
LLWVHHVFGRLKGLDAAQSREPLRYRGAALLIVPESWTRLGAEIINPNFRKGWIRQRSVRILTHFGVIRIMRREMAEDGDIPILERAYSDRQLIFVTADRVAEAARKETLVKPKENWQTGGWKNLEQGFNDRDWKKIAASSLDLYLGLTFGGWHNRAAAEAIRAWGRARESGIQILAVGKTEAKTIKFPPGHPRDGVLYIGHPVLSTVYYPMAEFHRVTFEHKFCEAIELLMSLGATHLRVEHVTGWSKEFQLESVYLLELRRKQQQ